MKSIVPLWQGHCKFNYLMNILFHQTPFACLQHRQTSAKNAAATPNFRWKALLVLMISCLSPILPVSANASDSGHPMALDAHFHYFPDHDNFRGIRLPTCEEDMALAKEDGYEITCGPEDFIPYKDFVDKSRFRTALLISPSFDIKRDAFKGSPRPPHIGHAWKGNESMITALDEQTSKITQDHPGRFIGLCGLNYGWQPADAVARVEHCINLPGMHGVKMHSFSAPDDQPLRIQQSTSVVEQVLTRVEGKKPIILWHIKEEWSSHCPNQEPSETCGYEEIDVLYQMAKKYPLAVFLTAHSLYSAAAVERLRSLELRDGKRLENLFLETSEAEPEKMKGAWINFGLDRVVIGTDNANLGDRAVEKLRSEFGLDPAQIRQVTELSPRRLLQRAGLTQYLMEQPVKSDLPSANGTR